MVLSVSELVWYFLSISSQGLSSLPLCSSFTYHYFCAFLCLSLSLSVYLSQVVDGLSICLSCFLRGLNMSLSTHLSALSPQSQCLNISHSNAFTSLSSHCHRLCLSVCIYSWLCRPSPSLIMVMDTDDPPGDSVPDKPYRLIYGLCHLRQSHSNVKLEELRKRPLQVLVYCSFSYIHLCLSGHIF